MVCECLEFFDSAMDIVARFWMAVMRRTNDIHRRVVHTKKNTPQPLRGLHRSRLKHLTSLFFVAALKSAFFDAINVLHPPFFIPVHAFYANQNDVATNEITISAFHIGTLLTRTFASCFESSRPSHLTTKCWLWSRASLTTVRIFSFCVLIFCKHSAQFRGFWLIRVDLFISIVLYKWLCLQNDFTFQFKRCENNFLKLIEFNFNCWHFVF